MTMTFEDYDKLLERFAKIKTKTFWPTLDQIDMFDREPEKYIIFACCLYQMGTPPKTNAEKYGKKNLYNFIIEHLVLVDSLENGSRGS